MSDGPYRVSVNYEVDTIMGPQRMQATCLIVPGHSTEWDIPQMVAVQRWGRPGYSRFVKILRVAAL